VGRLKTTVFKQRQQQQLEANNEQLQLK